MAGGVFDIFHDLPVERSVCVDPTFEEVNNLTTFSTHFPRTDFHCASWEELPLPDSSFDVGFSHNVLDHVTNPDDCISESVRVLKRNALCYISVNLGLGRKPPNYKHPHRFSIESFEELLHRHMTILSITREGPYAWASLQNSGA